MPFPPKSQRFPYGSIHVCAESRAEGTLVGAGVPRTPQAPLWLARFEPLTQVHWPAPNSQRSLRVPAQQPVESPPIPPKSQKLPEVSVQLTALLLTLASADEASVQVTCSTTSPAPAMPTRSLLSNSASGNDQADCLHRDWIDRLIRRNYPSGVSLIPDDQRN